MAASRVTGGFRKENRMRFSPPVPLLAAVLILGSLRSVASEPPGTAWRTQVKAFAAEHFQNPAWGYSHCERDYSLARSLALADHVTLDDDVLFAAAYLHDMAAFPPWADPKIDHADAAAAQSTAC